MDQKVLEQKSEIMVLNAKLEALRKDNKKIIDIHSKCKSENSDSLNHKIVQQKSEIMMLNSELEELKKQSKKLTDALSRHKSKNSDNLHKKVVQQKSETVIKSTKFETLRKDKQLDDDDSKYRSQKEAISGPIQINEVCMYVFNIYIYY